MKGDFFCKIPTGEADAKVKRINLLILDDFGVSPLKAEEARDILEIVEDRVNQ